MNACEVVNEKGTWFGLRQMAVICEEKVRDKSKRGAMCRCEGSMRGDAAQKANDKKEEGEMFV